MRTPEQPIRRTPLMDDGVRAQMNDPYPDDLTMQDPDEIFLTELVQKTEDEADTMQQAVIGKLHGNIRNKKDVTLHQTAFKRPMETQFIILESGGKLGLARFDKDKHGPWTDLADMNLTPVEFIAWYQTQEEPTPGLLKDFINLRKQKSAAKTHWRTDYHPKPKRYTK